MSATSRFFRLSALLLALAPAAPLFAGETLDLKPLPERKLSKLGKEAREHYDLAWKAIDTINYPEAQLEFEQAVEAEPDNIYLRELCAKMAIYEGGITSQQDSQRNYDIAIENLTAIAASPQINSNQKAKVLNTLKLTTDLRNAVFERDEMRTKYGEGFVKMQRDEQKEAETKKAAKEAEAKAKAAERQQGASGGRRPGFGASTGVD